MWQANEIKKRDANWTAKQINQTMEHAVWQANEIGKTQAITYAQLKDLKKSAKADIAVFAKEELDALTRALSQTKHPAVKH